MHETYPGCLDLNKQVVHAELTDKHKIKQVTACACSNVI